MNFFDFLPTLLDNFLSLQTQTQVQFRFESCSSMEASSHSPTDISSPGSSTECPDVAFPLPSRAVMLLVRPRQPSLSADPATQPGSLTDTNADFTRSPHPIQKPESFSKFASDLDSTAQSARLSSPVGKNRSRSRTQRQDLDNQKIVNTILATHNLELVASPPLPIPSTTTPRLSLQLYVKQPVLPTQLPDEVDTDTPVLIQARSDVPDEFSNALDTAPSNQPTSSLSLGSPVSTPNSPNDLNEVQQAYTIVGAFNPGTYENKILEPNPEPGSEPGLSIMKITSKRSSRAQAAERELNILKWLADISEDEQQRLGNQTTGFNFLQRMTTSFENSDLTFIVLEHHPASLTHPEIASRLRLQQSTQSGTMSTVPQVTLSPSQSIAARLRAVRLLAAELVLGLLFLHENGFVHEDIKPANVMISAAGHAVIGEFGAARRLPVAARGDSDNSSPESNPGQPSTGKYGPIVRRPTESSMYTSLYAAPETIETNSDGMLVYDTAVDFWSLGVLLHEVATGSLPFDNADLEGRSEGDISVSSRTSTVQVSAGHNGKGWDILLENLVKELLNPDPHARLRGPAVKYHLFFERILGIWDDIASLKHSPLPRPLTSQLVPPKYSPQPREMAETSPTSQEFGTRPTMGRVGLRSILKNRTQRPHQLDDNQDGSRNSNVVPEYIMPLVAKTDADPDVCDDCAATIQDESSSHISDSGLVIPEDIPRSQLGYDSPKSEASSSIHTPKSHARYPSDFDEELLSAAETCRHLEAYLSSGFYFNEPVTHTEPQIAAAEEPIHEQQFPGLQDDDGPSNNSVKFDPETETRTRKQSIAIAEVPNRDALQNRVSQADTIPDWSFEDEITVAVLDAINLRSSSPMKDEHGFLAPEDIRTQFPSRSRRTRTSIRKTFDSFRRRIGSS